MKRVVGRTNFLGNSSNMIDTTVLPFTAGSFWAAIIYCVHGAIFRRGGFKLQLEQNIAMVVVLREKLDTYSSFTDY